MVDHRIQVADQFFELVVFDAFRLVAKVVSALVDRHDLKVLGQLGHLRPPRVPKIGKSVDEDTRLAAPHRHVVNLDAVRVDLAILSQFGGNHGLRSDDGEKQADKKGDSKRTKLARHFESSGHWWFS